MCIIIYNVYCLLNSLPESLKVIQDVLEVYLTVYIESVPQISADDYASKAEIACKANIVIGHSSHGIYLLIYESKLGGSLQFLHGEARFLFRKFYAVKDVLQEYVVRVFFPLLQLAYVRTVHADLAFVVGRNWR